MQAFLFLKKLKASVEQLSALFISVYFYSRLRLALSEDWVPSAPTFLLRTGNALGTPCPLREAETAWAGGEEARGGRGGRLRMSHSKCSLRSAHP